MQRVRKIRKTGYGKGGKLEEARFKMQQKMCKKERRSSSSLQTMPEQISALLER